MTSSFWAKAIISLVIFFSITGAHINVKWPEDLILLGSADGRTYYAGGNTTMTWTNGKKYCEEFGFQLASIETSGQLSLLNESYNQQYFTAWHWTAGRDARLPREFSWDTTNSEVIVPVKDMIWSYSNCLAYYSFPGESSLDIRPCTSGGFVLCEVI